MQKSAALLNSWRLNLSNASNNNLMLGQHINGLGLEIGGIFLSDISLAVHIEWSNYNGQPASNVSNEDIKRAIGDLLRLVNGNAEQAGLMRPVVGIMQASNDRKNEINKWAADQDWHRGDFALFFVSDPKDNKDSKEANELILRLLSCATEAWSNIKPIKPLTSAQYLAKIRDERAISNLSTEHNSLLDCVESAWQDQSSMDLAVQNWLDGELKKIERLTSGSK